MGAEQQHHAAATLPDPGYVRPSRRSNGGFAVQVVGEDGTDFGVYDFSDLDAPVGVVMPLVDGFERATGSGGRWRTQLSVKQGAKVLRRFATKVVELQPGIEVIGELSPETWWAWRQWISEQNRWPGQINQTRALLHDTEGIADTTRRALNGRVSKPKQRQYQAYSRSEFRRVRAAGWRVVRAAARRISTNLEHLDAYRAGEEPDDTPSIQISWDIWTRGQILDEIARTGTFNLPSGVQPRQRARLRQMLGVTRRGHIAQAIYATSPEVAWLMVTLVCEQGYNASVLDTMQATTHRADDRRDDPAVYVAELDKPRRGPQARYFSNAFSGRRANLLELAIAITQPARDTMALLGHPTDKLLVARTLIDNHRRDTGMFKTDWSATGNRYAALREGSTILGDDGKPLKVTFQALRLTDQVINRRARQNSDAVSESVYRQPDPQTRQHAVGVITQGQADAVEHARTTLKMRTAGWHHPSNLASPETVAHELQVPQATAADLLSGNLNTATAACLDFTNSPFATEPGQPCPASFFACFSCTNAVATPDHLPRLVALHDALRRIASAVDASVWDADYAVHFRRLDDLLTANATTAEREQARQRISAKDTATIDRLLRRGWDAR